MRQLLILLVVCFTLAVRAATTNEAFAQGRAAYEVGDFAASASSFRQAAVAQPAAGTLQNLGNAEWRSGHTGPAVLAWERSQWLDPFNTNSRNDLRFARKTRFLDVPELPWYEICSSWLPVSAWPWLACVSFWLAAAMVMVPPILHWRRAGWHQALAAAGFAVFLLTLPAMYGIHTRAKLAVILSPGTILRLTPTAQGQTVAKLAAGETVRFEHARGRHAYVRTGNATGWIDQGEFGFIAGSD